MTVKTVYAMRPIFVDAESKDPLKEMHLYVTHVKTPNQFWHYEIGADGKFIQPRQFIRVAKTGSDYLFFVSAFSLDKFDLTKPLIVYDNIDLGIQNVQDVAACKKFALDIYKNLTFVAFENHFQNKSIFTSKRLSTKIDEKIELPLSKVHKEFFNFKISTSSKLSARAVINRRRGRLHFSAQRKEPFGIQHDLPPKSLPVVKRKTLA